MKAARCVQRVCGLDTVYMAISSGVLASFVQRFDLWCMFCKVGASVLLTDLVHDSEQFLDHPAPEGPILVAG